MNPVLLVDDEEGILEVLKEYLALENLSSENASSVDAALQWLENKVTDCVVTDIQMPGSSGIKLIQWMKINRPTTPVVVITGFSHYSHEELISMGASAIFEKPFLISDLSGMIKKVLK